jgi:hypothetical protein
MIDWQIDARQVDQLALDMVATEAQVRLALRTTLNKMATWLRGQSAKGLSKELQIQISVVRRRLKAVKFKTTPDGGVAKVWYGLNPIDLIWLKPKKTSDGVVASGRVVKGGFIAEGQVFKRAGASRLPLVKQSAPIQKPGEHYIDSGILWRQFEAQFWKTFEHELKWRTR